MALLKALACAVDLTPLNRRKPMQKHGMPTRETTDVCHQLWLIYAQLKDAESDRDRRLELLQRSREELGQAINAMNRSRFEMEICANDTSSQI